DEIIAEDVEIVGPAVMQYVPDDLDPRLARGLQHRQHAGEVIRARPAFNQVPANAVAHRLHPDIGETPVVLESETIMRCGADDVETAAGSQAMGGALEPTHEEAAERSHAALTAMSRRETPRSFAYRVSACATTWSML